MLVKTQWKTIRAKFFKQVFIVETLLDRLLILTLCPAIFQTILQTNNGREREIKSLTSRLSQNCVFTIKLTVELHLNENCLEYSEEGFQSHWTKKTRSRTIRGK